MSTFTADVDKFIAKSHDLLDAIFKQSVNDVINEAQTPVFKGGNMRVDTGFLRASGRARINALPVGESVNNLQAGERVQWDNKSVALVINNANLGDSIYFGWTANYAQHRENKDGFMRLAAQNWVQTVNKNTQRLKAMIK